jgi:hypothetical protein
VIETPWGRGEVNGTSKLVSAEGVQSDCRTELQIGFGGCLALCGGTDYFFYRTCSQDNASILTDPLIGCFGFSHMLKSKRKEANVRSKMAFHYESHRSDCVN